ncbi:hypothetical protein HY30_04485 [Hyphomonas chukchiensis]|uniref:Uncharacterized protein n=1 Tax=Hyphomonas chukchiensis TaxID=1280947 RepID=A0A062UAM1_9PROT|nr:hypothetical protein HY30_04485 [Hyphomonas chukchiensis]
MAGELKIWLSRQECVQSLPPLLSRRRAQPDLPIDLYDSLSKFFCACRHDVSSPLGFGGCRPIQLVLSLLGNAYDMKFPFAKRFIDQNYLKKFAK